MALYGSTIPTDHGEFVVTIICPNAYAQQKLMQACAGIVPSAGEPDSPPPGHHATEAPMPPHLAGYLDGREDDTGEKYDVSSDPTYAVGLTESDDEVSA